MSCSPTDTSLQPFPSASTGAGSATEPTGAESTFPAPTPGPAGVPSSPSLPGLQAWAAPPRAASHQQRQQRGHKVPLEAPLCSPEMLPGSCGESNQSPSQLHKLPTHQVRFPSAEVGLMGLIFPPKQTGPGAQATPSTAHTPNKPCSPWQSRQTGQQRPFPTRGMGTTTTGWDFCGERRAHLSHAARPKLGPALSSTARELIPSLCHCWPQRGLCKGNILFFSLVLPNPKCCFCWRNKCIFMYV